MFFVVSFFLTCRKEYSAPESLRPPLEQSLGMERYPLHLKGAEGIMLLFDWDRIDLDLHLAATLS